MLAAAAGATMLERMTVEELTQRAVLVVDGTVLGTQVDQSAGDVRTVVRLRVDTALKGAPGDVVTFAVPGGTLPDGTVVRVDAMPAFSAGRGVLRVRRRARLGDRRLPGQDPGGRRARLRRAA